MMNDELISSIFKSKETHSYKNYLKSKEIQERYWKEFLEEYDKLIIQNNKEYEEERKSFLELKGIIESKSFQHLLDNNKYCKKVNSILFKEKIIVGKSRLRLTSICQELSVLCAGYNKEYETFVVEAEKKMQKDLEKYDKESKLAIETIVNANVCKESFFNILCNNEMI